MNTSVMKNMVVLKNLPSNIIDEAIVILKPNIKVRALEGVDRNGKDKNKINYKSDNTKEYIVNEAQMIISNYITKVEKQNNKSNIDIKKIENKYKRLKIFAIFTTAILIINIALYL